MGNEDRMYTSIYHTALMFVYHDNAYTLQNFLVTRERFSCMFAQDNCEHVILSLRATVKS